MTDRLNNLQNEASDSEELKRYLLYEASDAERGQIESRFFDDDKLFYELLDLENDLTDRYARNELGESDKKRYAASLEKSPERRAKLANANALQSFIREESAAAPLIVAEEKPDFWSRLTAFFGLSAASFQYATAAFLFLSIVGIGVLIYERQRNAGELARLRESEIQRAAQVEQKENELRQQLKTVQERKQNLQNELRDEHGQTEILTEQLSREQAEKSRLIREIENLKRRKSIEVPENNQPPAPTIATVILAPVGGKGSGGGAKVISIKRDTSKISATLQIPKDSVAATFSVQLNSAPLVENIKPSRTKSGNKFIRVVFPAKNLTSDKENLLTVIGDDASRYNYALRRK